MTRRSDRHAVLAGGGEMGALMRSLDWSTTAVGPVERWPQSLKTALSILLETGFPMYIAWGPEFTQFYNDGYRPILGSTKHPAAMGISTRQTFAEIWDIIGPMFQGVMEGRPTTVVDFMLPLDRHGFAEECYFIFSYSPIREESGQVGGVLVTVTETSARVLGERRLKTTQALADQTRDARTIAQACEIAGRVLDGNRADVPGARIYLVSRADGSAALTASSGEMGVDLPDTLDANDPGFSEALRSTRGAHDLSPAGTLPGASRLLGLPIMQPGLATPQGLLVVTTSAMLRLDDTYRRFLGLVASQIGGAMAAAHALQEAQARADALAELDRAKTAFFSNVSHEFRTPLTLMLGPTEDALQSPDRALSGETLSVVYRNQLRLLKLVNTLLDFSRIEAGRVQATFAPTDLATLTADVASAFRSAAERAGLRLEVDCPPSASLAYVDREMWEKVVLNLLSNALKFTFEGSIAVRLTADDREATLKVRDTGVGIGPDEIDGVFERFHRVERTAARTHEGSGIGLALVRELVTLHGGTISASSELGAGTEFTVRVPLGRAHLPPDRIVEGRDAADAREASARIARPYLSEAAGWLPEEPTPAEEAAPPQKRREEAARVLVVDDNVDMRAYLTRLLEPLYRVEAVTNGRAALEAVRERRPDLVLTDVMMPDVDGFALLEALRGDDGTRSLPVIMLSARAGEEARIEGLEAGADAYLVKPFSARELLARVDAELSRTRLRAAEAAEFRRLAQIFEHAPVGVAVFQGPAHVIQLANPHYREIVGNREVVGRPVRDAFPELEGQGIFEILDQAYSSGAAQVGNSLHARMDRGSGPEDAYFDYACQPLFDADGAVSGLAVVIFDVTRLARAQAEAEAANRAKDEFLAMLGHELRNPLAPILTALQLMRLRNVSGADTERTVIERQVRHLVSLVDDLLDVSRIIGRKVTLKTELVDLADVVAHAIETTGPALEVRRHRLHVDVPRSLVVEADPSRLAQVVGNLLNNAAKYTDPGGSVTVSASRVGNHARVVVADTGRGIDPEMMPKIFDVFVQERQELDRSEGGLGLGLAIARRLVEAHGGSVRARSQGKGRGAEFIIDLPLAESTVRRDEGTRETPRAAASRRSTDRGLRVLLVDDNADAAGLLADLLIELGYEVRTAVDGPEALEISSEWTPDVALLDLGLPVMDGFELRRRLREQPGTADIDCVAITGYGREGDRDRTRAHGFAAHFVKPVEVSDLDAWLRRRQRERSASEQG